MIRRRTRLVIPFALAWLATACTVGPAYRPPERDVDPAFVRADAGGSSTLLSDPVESSWWQALGDARLDALVERARVANLDLREAEANLLAARALLGLERRDRWPTATARAAVEDQQTSEALLPQGIDRRETYWSAGLDASWELDLFGRVRRSVEAAAASFEAAEADRRGALVAVSGEVARTYVALTGARRRLAVARENVANQEASLDLVRTLVDAGRGTELDVERARAQFEATRSRLPLLETDEARALNRLAVLIGEPPGSVDDDVREAVHVPAPPERIAIGDPAGLLRRRPDVAAAERRLAAATARIGVATADLFPRVSLTGSFGTLATSFDDLVDSGNRTTSFGPFLRWAAFDLGRVRDRIRAAEAGADAALARYESTVLTALEETETALVRLDRARRREAHLIRAERAAARAADLARERYRVGLDSFLAVLDAESRLLAAQDERASGAVETAGAYVDLYVALGGGW